MYIGTESPALRTGNCGYMYMYIYCTCTYMYAAIHSSLFGLWCRGLNGGDRHGREGGGRGVLILDGCSV